MATTTTAMPADINAYDERGQTKIFLAAEAGDAAEVARLLELRADFDLPTSNYRKYLSLFNDKRILLIFFLFIQRRRAPLRIACEEGHAPVVRLLLEAGAKIQATDYLGFVLCLE